MKKSTDIMDQISEILLDAYRTGDTAKQTGNVPIDAEIADALERKRMVTDAEMKSLKSGSALPEIRKDVMGFDNLKESMIPEDEMKRRMKGAMELPKAGSRVASNTDKQSLKSGALKNIIRGLGKTGKVASKLLPITAPAMLAADTYAAGSDLVEGKPLGDVSKEFLDKQNILSEFTNKPMKDVSRMIEGTTKAMEDKKIKKAEKKAYDDYVKSPASFDKLKSDLNGDALSNIIEEVSRNKKIRDQEKRAKDAAISRGRKLVEEGGSSIDEDLLRRARDYAIPEEVATKQAMEKITPEEQAKIIRQMMEAKNNK